MHHSEVFVFCGAVSLGTLGIVLYSLEWVL